MDDDTRAVRDGYDRVAAKYAATFYDELSRKPFDRALLDAFAEEIQAAGLPGAVWDLGCGPGHVGRYLADRGLDVCGLDLSDAMLAIARRLNPAMRFVQGTMLAPPVENGTLAGIVSFYAIHHLPRGQAADALREFHRALRPSGRLLLGFHGGEGELVAEEMLGEPVDFHAALFAGSEMADYARQAGFTDVDVAERAPYDFEHPTQRVYLRAASPA
ncbi:MAG TPA: methyltransferase domain-containing protein [Ktedonobacterales bacterium]